MDYLIASCTSALLFFISASLWVKGRIEKHMRAEVSAWKKEAAQFIEESEKRATLDAVKVTEWKGVVFAAGIWVMPVVLSSENIFQAVAVGLLATLSVLAARYDAEWRIVPDALTMLLLWILAALTVSAELGWLPHISALRGHVADAAAGALVAWTILQFASYIFSAKGSTVALGGADLKIGTAVGMVAGFPGVFPMLLVSILCTLPLMTGRNRKKGIPYAIGLCSGLAVAALCNILAAY